MKKLSLVNIYEASEDEHLRRKRQRINIYFVANKYINSGRSIEDLKLDFEDDDQYFASDLVDLYKRDYLALKKRGELDHLLKLAKTRFGQ